MQKHRRISIAKQPAQDDREVPSVWSSINGNSPLYEIRVDFLRQDSTTRQASGFYPELNIRSLPVVPSSVNFQKCQ
jgi:hypothetical protein